MSNPIPDRIARHFVGEIQDLVEEIRRELRRRDRFLDMKGVRKIVSGSDDWLRENVLPNLTGHRIRGKVLYKESELRAFIELHAETKNPLLQRMLEL